MQYEKELIKLTDADENVIYEKEVVAPASWSHNAKTIFAMKYLYRGSVQGLIDGYKLPNYHALPDSNEYIDGEYDFRQTFHRLAKFWAKEVENRYKDPQRAEQFYNKVFRLLENQVFAPNSPQWFNAGLHLAYGVESGKNELWGLDENGNAYLSDNARKTPQLHACFLNDIEDSLCDDNGIFDFVKKEGTIFKFGSGSGCNFSNIRGEGEPLSGGGKSSGLMSFLRLYDQNAGVIKSGGTTRRSAKMILLDDDHPDLFEFVDWKVKEEIRALTLHLGSRNPKGELADHVRAHGYDFEDFQLDWDSETYRAVSGQNANNSIILSKEFMEKYLDDPNNKWELKYRVTGNVSRETTVGEVLTKIAKAAHFSGDPGVLFADRMNDDNVVLNDGEFKCVNPCSEYVFLENTACNLASINLKKFYNPETNLFDFKKFQEVCGLVQEILDISISKGGYPTREIAEGSAKYRTTGIGYANLGGLLMEMGIPYNSYEGRVVAALITALMHFSATAKSAEMARDLGAFPRYEKNEKHYWKVLGRKEKAYARVLTESEDILNSVNFVVKHFISDAAEAIESSLDNLVDTGNDHGFRNSHISLLAPTGTIGLIMDCETTGIEPDFSLVKYKQLSGGGFQRYVNPHALKAFPGLTEDEVAEKLQTEGLNAFEDEKLKEVFKCANDISWKGHIDMMAAVQPFLSGAISKTINMPKDATVEDVLEAYVYAYKAGLKAVAIYRDGSKFSQVLTHAGSDDTDGPDEKGDSDGDITFTHRVHNAILSSNEGLMKRRHMPDERESKTLKFVVGGRSIYIHLGYYDNGDLGEVFLDSFQEGSDMRAVLESFAKLFSIAMQHGVPLETLIDSFRGSKFEPSGFVRGPIEELRRVSSPLDLLVRVLELRDKKIPSKDEVTDKLIEEQLLNSQDFESSVTEEEWEKLKQLMSKDSRSNFGYPEDSGLDKDGNNMATVNDLAEARKAFAKLEKTTGETCHLCGSTRMVQNGTCSVCLSCGETTGC